MSSQMPFVDPETGAIDRNRVLAEAIPLAKLVGLVVAAALVPFAVVLLLGEYSTIGRGFVLLTQFVLAVGTGIVLMYIVARGMQVAEE
ncbi:hypothetical protein B4589_012435 [Halolamina sp. CBA1230]|uniref:hypothetical protein n=1 Tax=Halolamina sp. CBA1230 TaxID=1853690 RepID=UPI0009A1D576|nr:hypothetical protein [Halolamina sp. CBA1230]QKY21140.1 hypothetical protein B4589_012435 [Halolamina sp. CBA1230]